MNDLISRQAVFYVLENKMIDRPLASDRWVIRDIGKAIESLPTVEPKRPKGEWVLKDHLWECDQCGCRINRVEPLKGHIWNFKFCPNCGSRMCREDGECGAKMEGGDTEWQGKSCKKNG